MMNLLDRVRHEIEGEERLPWTSTSAEGTTESGEYVTFGPDRWIRHAKERRVITATQFLAIILFVLRDQFDPYRAGTIEEREQAIVDQWAAALRGAAGKGVVVARDANSLLPIAKVPTDFDWRLAVDAADEWVNSLGFGWTCTEIIEHLFKESFPGEIDTQAAHGHAENKATPEPESPARKTSGTGITAPLPDAMHPGERKAAARLIGGLVKYIYKDDLGKHGLVAEILRDLDQVKGVATVDRSTIDMWLKRAQEVSS